MRALAILAGAFALAAAAPVPPPKVDPPARGLQTAVLAGGCFWGVEAVFEHVKGVRSAVSGYAGGSAADASYDKVTSEGTGHAEAVRIVYDPAQVSYGDLLRIYFSVAHDPTQLNRQGPDVGPSYRSAIFPQNAAQREAARQYVAQLAAAKSFPRPIVTRIESGGFYPAEAYHQDFMRKNPRHPYILAHDVPKVAALKRIFPASYRD
jgi:peptide-methionine (S)-S-oxide reductase